MPPGSHQGRMAGALRPEVLEALNPATACCACARNVSSLLRASRVSQPVRAPLGQAQGLLRRRRLGG
jgi:hypothetical protein